MCIIAIKPQGKKMFNDKQLETMFINNPDGSGYMYYDKDKKTVVFKKGFMTLDALKKSLAEKDLTNTNVILHFRIGTSGYKDTLNCHPYPVYQKNKTEGTTDLAVAHNGILHEYTPQRNSDINDTQVFIQTVLSKLKRDFIYDKDKTNLIEELIGYNKLAFLDKNNKIKLIGYFIEDGGYIYSNDSYKPKPKPKYTYTPKTYNECVKIWGQEFYNDDDIWEYLEAREMK